MVTDRGKAGGRRVPDPETSPETPPVNQGEAPMFPTPSRRAARLLPVVALPIAALAIGGAASASAPPTAPDDTATVESIPEGFVRLIDDTGFLTVVVPDTWDMVDTVPAGNPDGSPQPWILASTVDLEGFNATFTSGVLYYAAPYEADPEAYVTSRGLSGGCETIAVQPYEDPIFTGFVQVGTNCGEDGGTWNMIAASPADQSFTAIVQLQISSADEQEAFDLVLSTFTYAGDPTIPPGMLVPSSSVPGSSTPG
jgi:hypothetical protein